LRCLIYLNPYTPHINLHDVAFLGVIFTGLNFALLLAFTKRTSQSANRFLALALAVMVLWMICIWDADVRLPLQFSLALGPLIYFYVLKLTRPEYKFRWKDLLNFIPVIPEQFILQNPLLQFLVFISVIAYLYYSHRLIERFYRRQKFNGSDRYRLELRWLHRLVKGLGLFCFAGLLYVAISYFYNHQAGLQPSYPFYLGAAGMLICIAVSAYLRPEIGMQANLSFFSKPPLPAELKQKGTWLKNVVKTNLYYQDPDLGLTSLAEKLGLTAHELSRILNTVLKKSFNDFINEYRVAEIKRRMEDPAYDHLTLLGIAYDSGFNSKSTFNLIFKKITGRTPAEYKAWLKKEFLSYNLGRHDQLAAVISNHETTSKWSQQKLNRNVMFRNYLKIAWRNVLRSKVYSSINVLGLAVGMSVALIVGLWVEYQYSFDKAVPNYAQLYQVKRNFNNNGEILTFSSTSLKLADALRNNIPGIEYVAESDWMGSHGLMVGNKKIYMDGAQIGSDFLKMFQYPLIEGNANTALKDAYSIVLTQSTATALFGNQSAINKTVRLDNRDNLKVTAILKDLPANSSFQFKYLVPFSYLEQTQQNVKRLRTGSFGNNAFQQFVKLKAGVTYEQVAGKIKDIEKSEPDNTNAKNSTVILQPLKDWHLYSEYKNGVARGGFIDYVRIFGLIGLLVLIIACINFVNLSTARSEKRAKEIWVRKAIGSEKKHLIFQFLTESTLIAGISFLFCLAFVRVALPTFNLLANTTVTIPFDNLLFWLIMLGYVLATGLLAGCKPAFYFSSFNTVKVLKGSVMDGRSNSLSRRILVVTQFSCSVALIISTVIIYKQVQYAKDRPIGYNISNLMTTKMNDDLHKNYVALKGDLLRYGLMQSVTTSSSPATDVNGHGDIANWPGKLPGETVEMGYIGISDDYFKTLGMQIKEGRDFIWTTKADSNSVLLNEAAVKRLRLKNPLSQLLTLDKQPIKIIGIVKDALMVSPFAEADPTVFYQGNGGNMIYRLSTNVNTHDAIAKLTAIFNKYNPAFPYTYRFVDEDYNKKFNLEVLIGKLAGILAALAILISCLGLFGLAAYVAEQRTKEIGIRKVLGASIGQIWVLLSKDSLIMVMISCVIASPIALYFLQNWLAKYEYHIRIGPDIFIASAVAAILITMITVSLQAIKVA